MKTRTTKRVASVLLLLVCGCPALPDANRPAPKPAPAPIHETGLITEQIVAARAQQATLYRAALGEIADQVANGKIVYATKLQLELDTAGRNAAVPVTTEFREHLDAEGKIKDPDHTADVIRQIQAAY